MPARSEQLQKEVVIVGIDTAGFCYQLQKYEEGQAVCRNTLAILKNLNHLGQTKQLQAAVYQLLAIFAAQLRNWQEASKYYELAAGSYEEFGDRLNQANTLHNLGVVYQEQRDWPQAEKYYQQSIVIKELLGNRYQQAGTYHQLGMVAQKQRQWGQAEAHYGQALALKIEFNDRYRQASIYGQLGLLAEAQEDWTQAGTYLVQALQLFAEFQDQHSVAITIHSLARLHRAGGDAELSAAVAGVLGVTVAEVVGLFAQALGEE